MYITDPQAPVYQKQCTIINAPAEKVWKMLADINRWPSIFDYVTKAKLNGPLKADTTFNWTANGFPIHSTLHIVEPYNNFGWSGRSLGIFAIHNWSFIEFDGMTSVTVSESMEGFIAKTFRKQLNRMLEKEMMKSLEYLRIACENQTSAEQGFSEKTKSKELIVH